MNLLIEVTQDCVRRGVPEDGAGCPVALGFRSLFRDAALVEVYEERGVGWLCEVHWSYQPRVVSRYRIPDHVGERIKNYDAGFSMEPHTFEAEPLT